MPAQNWFRRAVGRRAARAFELWQKRIRRSRLLVKVGNQAPAVTSRTEFAEIIAVYAVDLGVMEVPDFRSVSNEQRVSQPIAETNTAPRPEPFGARLLHCYRLAPTIPGLLRAHILPIVPFKNI